MMHKLTAAALSASFVVLLSCSTADNRKEPKELFVDADRCENLYIDTTRLLRFEASENSRLYSIDQLLPTSSRFVVRSRNKLRSFDRRTGAYAGDVAKYGQGETEYTDISKLWNNGDTIFIFDSNRKSVGKYMPDGTLVEMAYPFRDTEFREDQPMRMYFTMADGSLLSINGSTGGSTRTNPLVTQYNPDYSYKGIVPGREVKESSYMTDGVYDDTANNRLLIWEPLRDTVFSATEKGIVPLYVLNTGRHSFPAQARALKHLNNRLGYFYANADSTRYVSLIRYLQPDGDDLYFCLAGNDKHNYIVRYNVATDTCTIRSLASHDGRYTQTTFFLLDNDSLRIEIVNNSDIEANPAIYSIHKRELK